MVKLYSYATTTVFLLLFLFNSAQATHNRAGQITVEPVDSNCTNPLNIRATITTYTLTTSIQADRDSLTICWGDDNCEVIPRVNGNGNGEELPNNIKKNIYIGTHSYGGAGTYNISTEDPNRIDDIINISSSVTTRFYIETLYTITSAQFSDCNSTPTLTTDPIDFACVGQVFTHNLGAYDPNRDSLSFALITPLEGPNNPIDPDSYSFPDQIEPGPENNFTLDPVTGQIVWDAPQKEGIYNIAIYIIEWREGFPLDTMVRDMQIIVRECNNVPPELTTEIEEICVVAGELIEFDVTAGAPVFEEDQMVLLTAYGGPFEVNINPATFEPPLEDYQEDPFTRKFRWQTSCEHISDTYWQIVFRTVDDYFGPESGLATLKVVRIKVVGPPPVDVRAKALAGEMDITWELPYICEDAQGEYFKGFTVWRRESSNPFSIDSCTPGLAGRGYVQLNSAPLQDMEDGRYIYTDTDVERGKTYCYRVLAIFAQTSNAGYFYNLVESLPSNEACQQLGKDIPILTNVSVMETNIATGQINVCWSKPDPVDLDTIANPGPYRYEVLRAIGITNNPDDFQPTGISFESETFAGANDTCFTDINLNTADNPYSYQIGFYVDGRSEPLGIAPAASSIYLTTSPTDNTVILSWEEEVPWSNYEYIVYRKNNSGTFDAIATVATPAYRDEGLNNSTEYCYRIQSIGSYGIAGIINPIRNLSQERCEIPIDNIPPCPPEFVVDNLCGNGQTVDCNAALDLINTLRWTNPEELCAETDDVVGYNIYYAPVAGAELKLIATIDNDEVFSYEHIPERGIAGCYAVTALDSMQQNESELGDVICVDNCPFYELPNAFTPNGDGQNELFYPYPYCFIQSIDIKIFNRWGQLVFQTSDPNINWDGRNSRGQELAEGVYYYTCRVYEERVAGTIQSPMILRGYIELIRGRGR